MLILWKEKGEFFQFFSLLYLTKLVIYDKLIAPLTEGFIFVPDEEGGLNWKIPKEFS